MACSGEGNSHLRLIFAEFDTLRCRGHELVCQLNCRLIQEITPGEGKVIYGPFQPWGCFELFKFAFLCVVFNIVEISWLKRLKILFRLWRTGIENILEIPWSGVLGEKNLQTNQFGGPKIGLINNERKVHNFKFGKFNNL